MKVTVRNVRLAFAALFTPKAMPNEPADKAAFSCSLILDPEANAADIKAIEDAITATAKEKWGVKADTVMKGIRAKGDICLRSGDEKAEYDGFEGNMYVSCRSKTRPLVIDRDKSPLSEKDGRPYGGCYVNASIEVWAQDNNYGKRINCQIKGVQFYKDGEAFSGGGAASADDFDDLGVDETAGDLA